MKKFTILIVHRVKSRAEELAGLFMENPYVEGCVTCEKVEDAVVCMGKCHADLILLDAELPCSNYKKLIEKLRKVNIKAIFALTCDNGLDSLEVVGGRPIAEIKCACDLSFDRLSTLQDIHECVLEACIIGEKKFGATVIIRTFGSFAVMHEDKAIHFSNSKAKELLALCIDRMGSEISMEEVIDVLWPDRPYDDNVKRLYRKAISNLRTSLNETVGETLFKTSRGFCSLDVSKISCDYFMFMKEYRREKVDASVMDYYLPEYAWSEFTIAKLFFDSMKRKERKNLGDNE